MVNELRRRRRSVSLTFSLVSVHKNKHQSHQNGSERTKPHESIYAKYPHKYTTNWTVFGNTRPSPFSSFPVNHQLRDQGQIEGEKEGRFYPNINLLLLPLEEEGDQGEYLQHSQSVSFSSFWLSNFYYTLSRELPGPSTFLRNSSQCVTFYQALALLLNDTWLHLSADDAVEENRNRHADTPGEKKRRRSCHVAHLLIWHIHSGWDTIHIIRPSLFILPLLLLLVLVTGFLAGDEMKRRRTAATLHHSHDYHQEAHRPYHRLWSLIIWQRGHTITGEKTEQCHRRWDRNHQVMGTLDCFTSRK